MIAFFAFAGSIGVVVAFLLCKSLRVPPSEVKDEPDRPAKPPRIMPPPKPAVPAARVIVRDRR